MMWAVWCARRRSLDTTRSNDPLMCRAAVSACWRPRAVRGGSACPCHRPVAFHSDSPCRITSSWTSGTSNDASHR